MRRIKVNARRLYRELDETDKVLVQISAIAWALCGLLVLWGVIHLTML